MPNPDPEFGEMAIALDRLIPHYWCAAHPLVIIGALGALLERRLAVPWKVANAPLEDFTQLKILQRIILFEDQEKSGVETSFPTHHFLQNHSQKYSSNAKIRFISFICLVFYESLIWPLILTHQSFEFISTAN